MDAAQFRTAYPEFDDETRYTDPMITRQIAFAGTFVDVDRWGDLADEGIALYVAHHVAIQSRHVATAELGGTPGALVGAVTSKTVGPITTSYDTGAVSLADAGHWNATAYGVQFLTLARMCGAGALQL